MEPYGPVILGYRNWAKRIWRNIDSFPLRALRVGWAETAESIPATTPLVFLVGWSNIVPSEFFRHRTVLVLHPSPLPRYRGGSPIQHQIINGEISSAVSIFRLDEEHPGIDSGPLCFQQAFPLAGSLDDVFERIVTIGARAIGQLITDFESPHGIAYWEQSGPALVESRGSIYSSRFFQSDGRWWKRRKPEDGRIAGAALDQGDPREVENMARALYSETEDYPPAYVRTADGGRLELLKVRYVPYEEKPAQLGSSFQEGER